jgi:hypothetical protein
MDDLCKPLEDAVLAVLPGEYTDIWADQVYYRLDYIAKSAGLDRETARFVCRRLRDKGLAIYARGLFTEDGEVAGAGYALSPAGRELLQKQAGAE